MNVQVMVVARSGSLINKFRQESLRGALNLQDFLEQTGEYQSVSIFQRVSEFGPMAEWVEVGGAER